jgi:CRP/FNR family cyclic AMP-dependent transcriptional regulator
LPARALKPSTPPEPTGPAAELARPGLGRLWCDAVAPAVSVLELDPELGEGIGAERLMGAKAACLVEIVHLSRGGWKPGRESELARGGFGLLVLNGLLSRRVGLEGRFGAELLGPTDLLRPWDRTSSASTLPFAADWDVIKPARLAILGARFGARAAPYPEIAAELVGRALMRSRQLALTMAIVHHPKVETRLEMLLWVLAERWATVRPDGVALSLPLTHSLLADLVAASRPAVSTALSALAKRDRLRRERDLWLLLGDPPGELEDLGALAR